MTADDREALRQGISKLSFQSRYFRFFSGFAEPPPSIVDGLVDVDGDRHIAWCAVDLSTPETQAIAAVHAIRTSDNDQSAELAFAVLDAYHHRGIARLLIGAVLMDVQAAGLEQLTAEVLAENKAAARLFRALGADQAQRLGDVLSFNFTTSDALAELSQMTTPRALKTILSGAFSKDA
jgi:GNAT superfamily N-acetyltransferase